MDISSQIESVYVYLAEEFAEEGPGGVVRRIAMTQNRERDDIRRYLEQTLSEGAQRELALAFSAINEGHHRS